MTTTDEIIAKLPPERQIKIQSAVRCEVAKYKFKNKKRIHKMKKYFRYDDGYLCCYFSNKEINLPYCTQIPIRTVKTKWNTPRVYFFKKGGWSGVPDKTTIVYDMTTNYVIQGLISDDDTKKLDKFIELNREAILKYWFQKYDGAVLCNNIKPFKN